MVRSNSVAWTRTLIESIIVLALITTSCSTLGEDNVMPCVPSSLETTEVRFVDAVDYVVAKLKQHDLVMIGEPHGHVGPIFLQDVIRRCYEDNVIKYVFLEFGNFRDQPKVEKFLQSSEYHPELVTEVLRNFVNTGWGVQEYFDIFKLIYNENQKQPRGNRVEIVVVNGPADLRDAARTRAKLLEESLMPRAEKTSVVSWFGVSGADRDRFMSDVIEAYCLRSRDKGVYFAGSGHVSKALMQMGSGGRRCFGVGGLLSRLYPGRVFCITLPQSPHLWQTGDHPQYFEKLSKKAGRRVGLDTADCSADLRLASQVYEAGVPLAEAYDGIIVIDMDDNDQITLIPGFYDDEFAKIVWERSREMGKLENFPPEFRTKPPTGQELETMLKQGVQLAR